jgi:cell division protein FtsN
LFDYVYQVAAYKETGSADRLLARLKSAGLAAEIVRQEQNGTVWYRAVVRFRGRPDDVQSLRDALAPMGIGQILLRSKTPAE